MVKSYTRTGLVLFALCVLSFLPVIGASALQVNETVNGFRMSFDAINDTNMVAKVWSNGSMFAGIPMKAPTNEFAKGVAILAGNASDPYKRWGMCLILVLKNPENTSNIEKNVTQNNTNKYISVFDRIVDNHKALLLKTGNNASDPFMEYAALYWLDEANGKASKFVVVISQWPEKDAEKLLNTIHVEEIPATMPAH